MDYWQDETVTCGRPRMAGSVTDGRSHDEGGNGRNVTVVHEEGTGMSSPFTTMYWMACKYGFTVYYNVFLRIGR